MSGRKRQPNAGGESDESCRGPVEYDLRNQPGGLGAERGSNPELPGAVRHDVLHDSLNTDECQHQREAGGRSHQTRRDLALEHGIFDHGRQWFDVENDESWISLRQDLSELLDKR